MASKFPIKFVSEANLPATGGTEERIYITTDTLKMYKTDGDGNPLKLLFEGFYIKTSAVQLRNTGAEIIDSLTLALADEGKVFEVNKATDVTITIPDNDTVAFPVGSSMSFIKAGDGDVIIAGAAGVTLKSAYDLTTLATKEDQISIRKTATDTWRVFGADS